MAAETVTPIAVLAAASAIGIRPYDDGRTARWVDRAPAMLRAHKLVDRLGSRYHGEVPPPPYRDFARPPGGVRNEAALVTYSERLGARVGRLLAGRGRPFVLLLGGDCSIVLGALLGARRVGSRIGLVYIDAHADFATPAESQTGSAASMCLAMAVGRGDSPLARLAAPSLIRPDDVVLIGRRDRVEAAALDEAIAGSRVLDLTGDHLRAHGPAHTAAVALERVGDARVDGFWIHLDADVLDPAVMPAVDSPEPGGPDLDDVVALLAPLAQHPRALGLQLTIYDPTLDEDGACARRLVDLLHRALRHPTTLGGIDATRAFASH